MISRMCLIGAFGFAIVMAGCGGDEEKPQTPASGADTVKKEAGEALNAAKGFLGEKKGDLVEGMESKVAEMEKKVQELREQAKPKTDKAKAELEKAKAELDKKLAAAKSKLAEAKAAGSGAWKSVKSAFDTAITDLEAAYKKATSAAE